MTKTKPTYKKLTCFYCRYEITNTKTTKHVYYKQTKKTICNNCTTKKHKPLNKKLYENHDVQCTHCSKPVMYNKCISCAICDHFVHGKCLSLSTADIKRIENVCEFFICQPCTVEIFPQNTNLTNDDILHKKNKKPVKKNILEQCLTCTNVVPQKQHYPNKNIIYNGKNYRLCNNCSLLGIKAPVKNVSALEFLDCSICTKEVKYESLYCNKCLHWVHPHCNNINRRQFDQLSNTDGHWFCLPCSKTLSLNNSKIIRNNKLQQQQQPKMSL